MDVDNDVWLWKSASGKYRVEKRKEKTGWMGNEAGCKKADLKCGAVVKDSWIIRYSPKIDLYGVWKMENTDDLTDPDRQTLTDRTRPGQTPDPAGPDPTDPDPETRGLTGKIRNRIPRSRSGKTERSG